MKWTNPTKNSTPDAVLAARLLQARKSAGMTRAYVAAATGISESSLWNWEHERKRPKCTHVALLADLYGVSMDDLVGR